MVSVAIQNNYKYNVVSDSNSESDNENEENILSNLQDHYQH